MAVAAKATITSLIPLIYDAAEDPALWPETLTKIGESLRAVGRVLTIVDLLSGKDNMALAVGIDPVYQRLYEEHYESINIHIQHARPLLVPGRVLATHQFCSEQETLASEYYQDFLRPQDGWFHIVGGCVAKDKSLLSVLSFMRGRRAGHFNDREINLLEILMPHLQRAVRLRQVFARNHDLTACLDNLLIAAILVSEHGYVHFANREAHAIFQMNDGIGMDRYGCLTSTNNNLRQIIAGACQAVSGNGLSAGGSILVARTSGRQPYAVSVSPVRQANPFSIVQAPGAVVFVVNPEVKREPMVRALRRLYDLTAAEASLASLLVEGKDLTMACAELRIRRTTARTHLQHLCAKLGVRRQAELVSTILRTVRTLASEIESQ